MSRLQAGAQGHDRLLAFLEGEMDESQRLHVLEALEADPGLANRLAAAAAGLAAMRTYGAPWHTRRPAARGHVVAAVAATLILAVPTTLVLTRPADSVTSPVAAGMPSDVEPSYVIVLHGVWPDGDEISPEEGRRRAEEYWGWTSELAERGVLVAAGDLRWEPGERLGPSGLRVAVAAAEVDDPEYLVGMVAVRADTHDAALTIARLCPHLRYGGSTSIRRVGAGFVTVPNMGDWNGG